MGLGLGGFIGILISILRTSLIHHAGVCEELFLAAVNMKGLLSSGVQYYHRMSYDAPIRC